jgi:beta-glucanase (GH16 family)
VATAGLSACSALAASPAAIQVTPGTSAPTATVSPAPSGYSGDPGPGWKLTWRDDFTGGPLQGWSAVTSGDGGGLKELQGYDPGNATLAPGGGLMITANKGTNGQECWYGPCTYSSARLQTKGLFAQQYGLVEARIKIPAGKGIWPAFWMEGTDIDQVGWPAAGEIDVLEVNNKDPRLVSAYLHAPDEEYGAYHHLHQPLSAGYHVYGIDWRASGITWLLDGKPYGHVDAYPGWAFDKPFFLILSLAVGGVFPGSPDSTTPFPAQMDVSWVRVYQQGS